jgi:hypothetical protein
MKVISSCIHNEEGRKSDYESETNHGLFLERKK